MKAIHKRLIKLEEHIERRDAPRISSANDFSSLFSRPSHCLLPEHLRTAGSKLPRRASCIKISIRQSAGPRQLFMDDLKQDAPSLTEWARRQRLSRARAKAES